jgi:CubicO group peptidase (beta-lactamase class C family)
VFPTTEFALRHRVATEQATGRAPSLSAAVQRGRDVLWTGTGGTVDGAPPTTDTQYRIGSITKTFVAVLVMRLRDEGRLHLNDPLDKHLPGTSYGHVTIAQLLAHAAGLMAEAPGSWWERSLGVDWPTLQAGVTDADQVLRPGQRFHYSNLGYGTLGELVAQLRGHSWLDALRAEILAPLEMRRTDPMPVAPHALGWAVHPYADVLLPEPTPDTVAMAPAGQLWSTIDDLVRWVAFLSGDTGEVLHPDTVAEMAEPAVVDDADTWTSGYGLGLQVFRENGRRLTGHGGSMPGFLATVVVDQGTGTGAVTLANATNGVGVQKLALDMIRTVDDYEPALPAEWRPLAEVDPELLALTGSWYWGPTPHTLRLLDDRWLDLRPTTGRGRASRFRPEPDGTWTGLDGYYSGETLRVARHPDGSVSHLDVGTFVLTRSPYDPTAPIPGGLDDTGWRAGR